MITLPRIRIDDVLQSRNYSPAQLTAVSIMSFFDWFKQSAEIFDGKYVKLAIIAEGIDVYPEWVEMIKAQKGWEVQSHGWEHKVMKGMNYGDVYKEIKDSKEKIQNTFNRKVTQFYPPKHYYSPFMVEACHELDLSLMVDRNTTDHYMTDKTYQEVYYHLWNPRQIDQVERIVNDAS